MRLPGRAGARAAAVAAALLGVLLLAPGAPPDGRAAGPGSGPRLESEPSDSPCRSTWILPSGAGSAPDGIPPFEDDRLYRHWLRRTGAAFPGKAETVLTLEGGRRRGVRIEAVTAEVTRRAAPVEGIAVPPTGCDGPGPPLAPVIAVDLDGLPLGRAVSAWPQAGFGLPLDIGPGERFVLRFSGTTRRYDCDWRATVRWSDGVRTRTDVIDHHGRPFRVTATGTTATGAGAGR